MGRTCFSGPVYGAKAQLASFFCATIAPSASATEIGEILVPSTEEWYITDVHAYCANQGNACDIDVESPNGTSLLGSDLALSSAAAVQVTLTADGGESEGKKVAAGARIHIEADNGTTTSATNVQVNILGYIRKLNMPA